MSQPSRVSVLGASLDTGNRGVNALGESVERLIHEIAPETSATFHYYARTGGRRHGVTVLNCRLSPKSKAREHLGVILFLGLLARLGPQAPARRTPWLAALLDASFIGDIRGGDSLSDIYGPRNFFVGSLPLLSVILLGRPYVLLPQTYGPFKTRAARWLASLMIRRAREVWTRDRRCIPIVEALAGRTPRFSPDVAFTLAPAQPVEMAFDPPGVDWQAAPVLAGVNVSGLLYMGGYTGDNMFGLRSDYRETVDRVVETLLSRTTATILIVPHTFGVEREEEACAALLESTRARHPGRVVRLTTALRAAEVKWLIGRTHFFVGSRMHACIGALSQCVPTVGLGYSDKFLGVFESAGVGDAVVDLRHYDADTVSHEVLRLFECRAATAACLQERIPGVQAQVRDAFASLGDFGSAASPA
jgi:polysaccharide pyruvyl transferase WcaK-like protein